MQAKHPCGSQARKAAGLPKHILSRLRLIGSIIITSVLLVGENGNGAGIESSPMMQSDAVDMVTLRI